MVSSGQRQRLSPIWYVVTTQHTFGNLCRSQFGMSTGYCYSAVLATLPTHIVCAHKPGLYIEGQVQVYISIQTELS